MFKATGEAIDFRQLLATMTKLGDTLPYKKYDVHLNIYGENIGNGVIGAPIQRYFDEPDWRSDSCLLVQFLGGVNSLDMTNGGVTKIRLCLDNSASANGQPMKMLDIGRIKSKIKKANMDKTLMCYVNDGLAENNLDADIIIIGYTGNYVFKSL